MSNDELVAFVTAEPARTAKLDTVCLQGHKGSCPADSARPVRTAARNLCPLHQL
jgi:hypothetical protein